MKNTFLVFFFYISLFLAVVSCKDSAGETNFTSEEVAQESAKLDNFFEREFQHELDQSPMLQTRLGIKKSHGQWDNFSHLRYAEDLEEAKKKLTFLEDSIQFEALDENSKLNYRIYKQQLENVINGYDFRFYNYPINPVNGIQTEIPAFLINMHKINSVEDAEAYISLLKKIPQVFRDVLKAVQLREFNGVVPPQFVLDESIESSRNIIKGKPFEKSSEESALLADFKQKIVSLDISSEEKNKLLLEAQHAMVDSVQPAYENLISSLEDQRQRATSDDGVWKLPKGKEFYQNALQNFTNTELSAEDIHKLGLQEVARIHAEMEKIKEEVGFKGSLKDFFDFLRTDEQFYFENTPEGRQKYLDETQAVLNTMKGHLGELFMNKPKAELVVEAVEPFREKTAPLEFYVAPSPEGSRPGIFYVNLYNMAIMPKYEMESMAYHQGIPGHHLQTALAQELDSIPGFRKIASIPGYEEGWALYAEKIPKKVGLYKDPYSNFGRLARELQHALGLVVDTGIHARKWTREEAIEYFENNSPISEGEAKKIVERQIIMPGRATASMMGMLKITELSEKAKEALGEDFDIKEFHHAVLKNGAVPLSILEKQVTEWIENKKS